jgi:hypothetical protein
MPTSSSTLSSSLSAIIQSFDAIYSDLLTVSLHKLQILPAHCGIQGNDEQDILAKEVLDQLMLYKKIII